MKEKELRERAECAMCHRKIGERGITFWTIKLDRYMLNISAMRQQDGLAALLGDSFLANHMGPNEDLADHVQHFDLTLCEPCALTLEPVQRSLTDDKTPGN